MNRLDNHCHRSRKYYTSWAEQGTRRLKTGKLNRRTLMRIRFYELKIQLSDFWERIANSIHTSLFNKTDAAGNKRYSTAGNQNVSRHNSRRRQKIKCKSSYTSSASSKQPRSKGKSSHKRKFHSDRESKGIRHTFTSRRSSPESYNNERHMTRCSIKERYSKKEFQGSKPRRRKQRSSLTKTKSTILADQVHFSSSKKSMEKGDIPFPESRKSSSDSVKRNYRTDWKTRKNAPTKSRSRRKYRKPNNSSSESSSFPTTTTACSSEEDLKSDKDKKSGNVKHKADGDICKDAKEIPALPQSRQLSSFEGSGPGQGNGSDASNAVNDTKGIWKRLGSFLVSKRTRRKDIDSLPPKLVKFGIQLNPPSDKTRKRDRENSSSNDHDNSQNAPPPQQLHLQQNLLYPHQNRDATTSKFNHNLLSTSEGKGPDRSPLSRIPTTQPVLENEQVNSKDSCTGILSRLRAKLRSTRNSDPDIPANLQSSVSESGGGGGAPNYSENNFNDFSASVRPSQLPRSSNYGSSSVDCSRAHIQATVAMMSVRRGSGGPARIYCPQTEFTSQYKHLLASN